MSVVTKKQGLIIILKKNKKTHIVHIKQELWKIGLKSCNSNWMKPDKHWNGPIGFSLWSQIQKKHIFVH